MPHGIGSRYSGLGCGMFSVLAIPKPFLAPLVPAHRYMEENDSASIKRLADVEAEKNMGELSFP